MVRGVGARLHAVTARSGAARAKSRSRPVTAHPPAALTEVRYDAAHALAAERKAAGIHEPVRVPSAIPMLHAGDLGALAEAAYGERASRTARECFEKLRADGRQPTVDLIL